MSLVIAALKNPQLLTELAAPAWSQLVVEADAAGLLGRLHVLAQERAIVVPPYAAWHLQAAFKLAQQQVAQARREASELQSLCDWLGVRAVFLKGVAYILRDLPPARGRSFADIDIMVPVSCLTQLERHLRLRHWLHAGIDDYDDYYYRQWMHEIPPLRHAKRGTVLDLHHNILPLTSPDVPDVEAFTITRCSVERVGCISTLSDTDLFIHASVHLFSESEYHNGLRDLSDLDLLLRHFSGLADDYQSRLLSRARVLGLEVYVLLALRQCHRVLCSPIDSTPIAGIGYAASVTTRWRDRLLDECYDRVFMPPHSSCRRFGHGLAVFILFCRGHSLRMPLRLLIPHLLRKSVKRIAEGWKEREKGV